MTLSRKNKGAVHETLPPLLHPRADGRTLLLLLAGIGRNRAFLVIMPVVAAVQLLIIYFGGEVFRCVPLDGRELLLCAVFAFTVIPVDTIRKCVCKLRNNQK